jgi:MacB-like periplasmic core domain
MKNRFPSVAAIVVALATACDRQSPAFVQPPATEFTASRFELASGSTVDTVPGAAITQQFLRVIGVHALLGRLFIAEDFQPAGPSTAVLTYDLWQRRFGGDPSIIGKPIRLNGTDAVVVGVIPQKVEYPPGAAVWITRR